MIIINSLFYYKIGRNLCLQMVSEGDKDRHSSALNLKHLLGDNYK